MNKILVPLNSLESLFPLLDAGADEFYIGFYDDDWQEEFGKYSEVNRMSGFRERANKLNFGELLQVVRCIKEQNRDVFITFNGATYSNDELQKIENYFEKLSESGADGVIISVPQLADIAIKYNLEPVASTMCAIYNSDLVKFYGDLGVKRMILPRDLSIAEIEHIVSNNSQIEYEVFLMRNGCQFSDSYCLGFHRPECGSMCGMLNHAPKQIFSTKSDFETQHEVELNEMLYSNVFHHFAACGLCALYRFVKMGITAYKIVGRAENFNGIVEDIGLIKENINIALKCKTEGEFLNAMKMIPASRQACKLGMGCYYPEIRF